MENEKLDQILNIVMDIKTRVTNLETDVAELKSDVAELKTRVTNLESDVAELKTEVATLKLDVAELKVEFKEIKELAQENREDFMLTKEYIEKKDREARRDRTDNGAFRAAQEVEIKAIKNKVTEIDEKVGILNVKFEKMFEQKAKNMVAI